MDSLVAPGPLGFLQIYTSRQQSPIPLHLRDGLVSERVIYGGDESIPWAVNPLGPMIRWRRSFNG